MEAKLIIENLEVGPIMANCYVVGCEEVASGLGEFVSLGMRNRLLGWAENLIRSRFDLDEDKRRIAIDHNKVNLARVAGIIASEGFVPFCSEELFAAFLAPSSELLHIGQESAAIQQHDRGYLEIVWSLWRWASRTDLPVRSRR